MQLFQKGVIKKLVPSRSIWNADLLGLIWGKYNPQMQILTDDN